MTVREQLAEICQLQVAEQFLLTAFYLEPHELDSIRPLLSPDEPATGACGRFEGVPVFAKSSGILVDQGQRRVSRGTIEYAIAGGHWDIGNVVGE